MNKRCACNCSSKYQQNFVSPTLHFCKVKWLSFGEMTSKRCPMPWGHETAIPERAAVPCRKWRSTVAQEAWSCQQQSCSSEVHNHTLGLGALLPASMASGFATFPQPDLNWGLSCLPAHTSCHQSCKPGVIQSSWALVPRYFFLEKKLIAFACIHCQKHTLKPPAALIGMETGSRSETDREVERSQLQGLKQHSSQGATTSERHRALINHF